MQSERVSDSCTSVPFTTCPQTDSLRSCADCWHSVDAGCCCCRNQKKGQRAYVRVDFNSACGDKCLVLSEHLSALIALRLCASFLFN